MRTAAEKEEARLNIEQAEADVKKYETAGQEADARVARIRVECWKVWLEVTPEVQSTIDQLVETLEMHVLNACDVLCRHHPEVLSDIGERELLRQFREKLAEMDRGPQE